MDPFSLNIDGKEYILTNSDKSITVKSGKEIIGTLLGVTLPEEEFDKNDFLAEEALKEEMSGYVHEILQKKKEDEFEKRYKQFIKNRIDSGKEALTRTQNDWIRFFLQDNIVDEISKTGDVQKIFKEVVKFIKYEK